MMQNKASAGYESYTCIGQLIYSQCIELYQFLKLIINNQVLRKTGKMAYKY